MSKISHHDYRCQFSFVEHISQGAFGRVSKVSNRQTKLLYALKRIEVKSQEQLKQCMQEVQMLQKIGEIRKRSIEMCRDGNIWDLVIQMHRYYVVEVKNSYSKATHQVGIIFQLAQHSLQQIIKSSKKLSQQPKIKRLSKYLEQSNCLQFCINFIKLLKQFQSMGIAHRDIKPGNILAFLDESTGRLMWKLADFGFAIYVSSQRGTNIADEPVSIAGSYEYASPKLRQILKFPSKNKQKYDYFKNDVYSLGITMLEIITGSTQINEISCKALIGQAIDKRLSKLVQMMLEKDEEKRPCFKKLHEFAQKVCGEYFQSDQNTHQLNSCIVDKQDKLSRVQTQCTQFQINSKVDQCPESPLITKTVRKFAKQEQTRQQLSAQSLIQQITSRTISIGSPITSVAFITQSIIMCGCQNGDIVIVIVVINLGKNVDKTKKRLNKNDKKIKKQQQMNSEYRIKVTGVHNAAVTQIIHNKQHDKMWTAGYDGQVIGWNLQLLKLLINSKIKQNQSQNNKNLFIKKQQLSGIQTKLTIQIPNKSPLQNKPKVNKISSIYIKDANNYIIAYYSGYIYIKWNQKNAYIQLHKQPVTALVLIGNILFSSSMDGSIRSINMLQLQTSSIIFVYKCGIMGMHMDKNNKQLVCLTQNKEIITISAPILQVTQVSQLPPQQIYLTSTMSSINNNINSDMLYTASQNGTVYAVNTKNNGVKQIYISNNNNRGINCMASMSVSLQQNEKENKEYIVMGGYDGKLTVIAIHKSSNII